MPIEFKCENCNSILRTPDDAAGKQSRCPQCAHIQSIPSAPTSDASDRAQPSVPSVPKSFASEKTVVDMPRDAFAQPVEQPEQPPAPAPFEPAPFQQPPAYNNPYANPPAEGPIDQRAAQPRYIQRDPRQSVRAPAICLLVINTLLLLMAGLASLVGIAEVINGNGDPESMITLVSLAIWGTGLFVAIIGNYSMLRMRRYPLSVAGAMLPILLGGCCPMTLGFGIWATVVLFGSNVRQNFR